MIKEIPQKIVIMMRMVLFAIMRPMIMMTRVLQLEEHIIPKMEQHMLIGDIKEMEQFGNPYNMIQMEMR